MEVSQFNPPLFRQSTEAGSLLSRTPSRVMIVVFKAGMSVAAAAVGSEPGGPTGVVKLETAMVSHTKGSKVCVTVRGIVVPPSPWLVTVVFLGAGPGVGTTRGGPVVAAGVEAGGELEGIEMGKVGWIRVNVGRDCEVCE